VLAAGIFYCPFGFNCVAITNSLTLTEFVLSFLSFQRGIAMVTIGFWRVVLVFSGMSINVRSWCHIQNYFFCMVISFRTLCSVSRRKVKSTDLRQRGSKYFTFPVCRENSTLILLKKQYLWRTNSDCCRSRRFFCQAKFLTWKIADLTPTAHARIGFPDHAFRKRWLFTEISNMLRTGD